MDRLASVSIDLDAIVHYARIHALPEPAPGADPVYRVATERFGELCARHGIPATVFVIGEPVDPRAPGGTDAARAVRRLVEAGHEPANHTYSHDYRISVRPRAEIDAEIARGAAVIEKATGVRPVGFRAPGYNVSEPLLDALDDAGVLYDASVFPSAAYYLARATILAGMKLARRHSVSMAGPPGVLLAPRGPYHPRRGAFHRRGDRALVELPMAVVPGTGLPLIGTSVTSLPWAGVRAGLALAARKSFVSLELHGIDLMDETDGIDPAIVRSQPDLRVPVAEKLRRLDFALARLADDHRMVTLAEAARANHRG